MTDWLEEAAKKVPEARRDEYISFVTERLAQSADDFMQGDSPSITAAKEEQEFIKTALKPGANPEQVRMISARLSYLQNLPHRNEEQDRERRELGKMLESYFKRYSGSKKQWR